MYRFIFFILFVTSCKSSIERKSNEVILRNTTIDNESCSSLDGKALFQANCASCHHPLKDATGPALAGIARKRSAEWIHKFLTKRDELKVDSSLRNVLKFNKVLDCIKLPDITVEQIEAIMSYAPGCKGLPKSNN